MSCQTIPKTEQRRLHFGYTRFPGFFLFFFILIYHFILFTFLLKNVDTLRYPTNSYVYSLSTDFDHGNIGAMFFLEEGVIVRGTPLTPYHFTSPKSRSRSRLRSIPIPTPTRSRRDTRLCSSPSFLPFLLCRSIPSMTPFHVILLVPCTWHLVYIRLHLQRDPHPFLFGSPARFVTSCIRLLVL